MFYLLRVRFIEEEKTKGWQLPVMSDEYIESLISDRFTRLKAVWTQGSRQLRFDGHLETREEIQARLVQSREERLKAARHRERQATVRISAVDIPICCQFICQKLGIRKHVVEGFIQLRMDSTSGSGKLKIWNWLEEMLNYLDMDGMSSEESNEENCRPIY